MLDDATVCIEFSLRPTHSQQPCTARQAGNHRRNLTTLRPHDSVFSSLFCAAIPSGYIMFSIDPTASKQPTNVKSNAQRPTLQPMITYAQRQLASPPSSKVENNVQMLQLTMSSQHQCRSSNAPTESRSNAMGSRQGPPEQRSATSPLAGSTETNRDVTQPGRISMSKCQQLFNTHSCHHS